MTEYKWDEYSNGLNVTALVWFSDGRKREDNKAKVARLGRTGSEREHWRATDNLPTLKHWLMLVCKEITQSQGRYQL